MPRERLPMRKIGDVLRLHAGGLSKRRKRLVNPPYLTASLSATVPA